MRKAFISLLALAALGASAGCALADSSAAYRHDEPSEYYLYVPEEYGGLHPWHLFIALHGEGEDGGDCIRSWLEIATESKVLLLCPTLKIEDGAVDQADAENRMAGILTRLYNDYALEDRFFVTGYSAGADFALRYAYRYPQAIEGVSAISPEVYPQIIARAADIPIVIVADGREAAELQAAKDFVKNLEGVGFPARMVDIRGVDRRLSYDAQRVSIEFFQQVTR